MDMKQIHEMLIPHFKEQGVDFTSLTEEEMRERYPRTMRLGDLVEKYMGSASERDIPFTTLSLLIAEKVENCKNRLELELIFIEASFSIQELYISGFQKIMGITDEQAEGMRNAYRHTVDMVVRPAVQKALDEFFLS